MAGPAGRSPDEEALLQKAMRVLPGGVLGGYYAPQELAFVVREAHGPRLYDFSGREYIDYILGSGPLVLGHAHPAVVAAVEAQLRKGTTYFQLSEPTLALAEELCRAVPCAEQIRFCGSGSEATFFALLVATFNDVAEAQAMIEAHHHDLAAVIMEPLQRLVVPQPGFLQGVREITARHGVPLIFDEIVTGFRFAYGGAQEYYGVVPDLAAFGKIIGGGFPLAAVAGRRDIMRHFSQEMSEGGFVQQAGTLNGNPIAAAAGLATLAELRRPGTYERLFATGTRLKQGLEAAARGAGLPAQVVGEAPVFEIYFTDRPITDYRATLSADQALHAAFTRELLTRGVVKAAQKFYVSLVHTEAEVARTLEVFNEALTAVAGTSH